MTDQTPRSVNEENVSAFILCRPCLSIRYVRAREHFDSSPPGEAGRGQQSAAATAAVTAAEAPSLQLQQRARHSAVFGREEARQAAVS